MFSFAHLLVQSDVFEYLSNHSYEFIELIYDFDSIKEQKDKIEEFVQLQSHRIEDLDFNESINRAFVFSLLDIAQKMDSPSCFDILYRIANEKGVTIDACMKAAKLFMLDTVFDNSKYLDIFDDVCLLLDYAIENEDDNENRALAIFTSYYNAVSQRNPIWIERFRELIIAYRYKYRILSYDHIDRILDIDTTATFECYECLNRMRDSLLKPHEVNTIYMPTDSMESGTWYAQEIAQADEINIPVIRTIAMQGSQSEELKGRGVSPLVSEKEMNVYLRNYGNMHYAKLLSAINCIDLSQMLSHVSSLEIIDWGCGQGLATITLLEKMKHSKTSVRHCKITLIEPSNICIKRAALNINEAVKRLQHDNHINHCAIRTICKEFDALVLSDIQTDESSFKIHLFSNILDVELFSISALESYILNTYRGDNLFICVSPYINDSKTYRVRSLSSFFKQNSGRYSLLGDTHTTNTQSDPYWNCNNKFNGFLCSTHLDGCERQWTKVINVFRVLL